MGSLLSATRKKGSLSKFLNDFEKRLDDAIVEEAKDITKDFEKTTAEWWTPVNFFTYDLGDHSRKVFTKNKIYGYVSGGTVPHVIRPKKAKVLAFMVPYTAKTQPGKLASGGGGRGNTPAFAKEVHHPGTKPRGFDKLVAEAAKPRFYKRLKALIASMAK